MAGSPPRFILNGSSGEEEAVGGGLQSQRARGGEGEALRAPGAGLIPISWWGANVHAIYCMTASRISINPLHEAGNREGGLQGRQEPRVCGCVQIRRGNKEGNKEAEQTKKWEKDETSENEEKTTV